MKKFSFGTLSFLLCVFFLAVAVNGQTTFTNSAPIAIADSDGTTSGIGNPYPSRITVSGLSGTVTDVNVRINGLTHTFPDDVGLMLVGPGATRFMVVQSDVGGGTDTAAVVYTLDDQAAAGIPNAGPLTAGTYKPSSVGDDELFPLSGATPPPADCQPAGECPQAAPAGAAVMNTVFGGINPNGEWRLYAVDCCALDEGTIVNGWSVIITTSGSAVPTDAPADFNGDGKTDYVVARATNTPFAPEFANGQDGGTLFRNADGTPKELKDSGGTNSLVEFPIYWYVSINGAATTQGAQWGRINDVATTPATNDIPVTEDGDGDGKDDYIVWRPSATPAQSRFFFLQSNGTVRNELFGEPGDDPTVIGDYDGDGKADAAVFRPSNATWYYRGTLNNPAGNITFVKWGTPGAGAAQVNFPAPGDYDGDGKNDFCVQQPIGATTNGQFVLLKAAGGVEWVPWGLASDLVVPGDYDADGKTDFCVRRTEASGRAYYILERDGGGTGNSPIRFGGIAGNTTAQGDYNGDGRTDIAIWVPGTASTTYFYVRDTASGAVSTFEWGQPNDFPVAAFNTH
jgi:hypothetical protein